MDRVRFVTRSVLTSTGDVVLDAKVSVWTSWVVAGCEDDAAHCLDFADHTGHCWSRHDAILTNHQVVDLQEGTKSKKHCKHSKINVAKNLRKSIISDYLYLQN